MMEHESSVEPDFIKDTADITPLTVIEAVTEAVSSQNLEGVQKFHIFVMHLLPHPTK